MANHELQLTLAQWLRRQLEEGITVTEEVLGYLEGTFGTRDLAGVLADEDSGEVDSLLELLFYPDLDLQIKFEARWGRETFTGRDRDTVVDALCDDPPTAQLALHETGEQLLLTVPVFAIRTFVQRLNICRRLPEQLTHALDDRNIGDAGMLARVQLRNARLAWHAGQVGLAGQFLSKMPAPSGSFSSDLDFLLTILPELAIDEEAYGFLVRKKFFYFKSLCSAEDFERKRTASNMEIMMLSGARSAHGNMEEWRQLMLRVDRICQSLFGRTEFFQQPDSQNIDLQGGRNMEDVVHKLS